MPMLEFYENVLNNVAQDPNEKWREGQQAVVDRLYDDTTLKITVEEEEMPFNFVFHKIDAWVDNVTEATLNAEKDDSDYKTIFFKDCDHKSIRGRYYKFEDNYWMVYADPSREEVTSSLKVRRCNNWLKWVDKKGVLHEYPCTLDYSLSSTNSQTSRMIQQANSHITVIVQGNKDTLSLNKNMRFIFNGVCYRFFAVNNYMQNSYVDKNTPILFYDFYEEMTIDTDNLEENIADDTRSNFIISSDITDIQSPNGYSNQLEITVYNGGKVIENPELVFISDDESVITIDNNGSYEIVGGVGQEAEITVMIKNNVLSTLVIPVRVVESFMDNYTIKLSESPQKLRQGDKMTIDAYTYNHDTMVSDTITCTPNYIDNKCYTLHQISPNTWEITNVKPSSKELVLTFSSTYGIEVKKSIKLTAMW